MQEYVRNKKEQLDEKATVRFKTMPGLRGQMDWAFFEDHTDPYPDMPTQEKKRQQFYNKNTRQVQLPAGYECAVFCIAFFQQFQKIKTSPVVFKQ